MLMTTTTATTATPTTRRLARGIAAAVVGCLLLASCDSGAPGGATATTSSAPTTSTASPTTDNETTTTTTTTAATLATSTTSSPLTPTTLPAAPTTIALPPGEIRQPPQPATGPGSSDAPHTDWRESSGGSGADAWFVFEPIGPTPADAPLAIIMHGYFGFAGYDSFYELIRHTVLAGNIVIYPRWQTDIVTPCAGPFDIEPCLTSATNGITGALDFLQADPSRVQPDLDRASYFGFSFGGIITANLANRHVDLGLPVPRVIFLDDPHDGGLAGAGEPALDDSLAGIPADVLLQCHVGAEGVISEAGKAGSSCNALFPMLSHIPDENKDLVMTRPDGHGAPALSSIHGVCSAAAGDADAYDWGFCWKVWDALRDTAYNGTNLALRDAALGDTPAHRDNGAWNDGVPVAPLTIQDAAPITP